ncbi:hypothetical protein RFI_25170, partial [Reticulomyxa filosa]
MGEILEDAEFINAFESFVCDFPIVNIPSLGDFANPLTFPIKDKVLSKIIEISTESPYGHGTETKTDKEVRTGVELSSEQFVLENFLLNSRNNPILEKIRLELTGHIEYITQCLINTKYQKGHFGTLLLSLPTEEGFEGGSLILSFEDKNVEWNPSQEEKSNGASSMDWLAFYTDISHEIKTVTKGRRVTIAFNLIVPEECRDDLGNFKDTSKIEKSLMSLNDKRAAETLVRGVYELFKIDLPQEIAGLISTMASSHRVIEEIERLLSKNMYDINYKKRWENKAVCVVFSHRYTGHEVEEDEFTRANLKGRDVAIYTILSQVFHSFVTCCK